MSSIAIVVHDSLPAEATAAVDDGLGTANQASAPLHEVQPLACFAYTADGQLAGGAVGRRWGACCELQQLWVQPQARHQGIATRLVQAFENRAHAHGCRLIYLETFSFQAPALYLGLGYSVSSELRGFPQDIVKYLMVKDLPR